MSICLTTWFWDLKGLAHCQRVLCFAQLASYPQLKGVGRTRMYENTQRYLPQGEG